MKAESEGGFATIWLVLILSSIMLFLLAAAESAAGFAASSVGENLCVSAGRSVLSEYDSLLFERYGIFALRSGDIRLTQIGSYYIECGLGNDSGLVRMDLASCNVSGEEFPALSHELLMDQIRPLGIAMGIESIVSENSLTGLISGLAGASELADGIGDGQIEDLTSLCETEAVDEAAEEDLTLQRLKGEELLQNYNEAVNPELKGRKGASLSSELKSELPSSVLGVSPTLSLLLSGGVADVSGDAFAAGEYILNMCSGFLNTTDKSVLNGEIEYILYGHDSDMANEAAVRLSLFEIRSAVDLAEIYSDAAALAEINAAALAFAPVPQPLAAFAIASAEAAVQAACEVETLFSGGKVPFVKGGSGGSYEEYLRVLLVLLPQKTKLVRLMDIIQMDMTEIEGAAFAFRDYCCGVRVDACLEKKMHVFGMGGMDKRQGNVSVQLRYQ